MALKNEHIKWFRDSSPYIDAHRDRTFVICLAGDALRSENLKNIVSDCALLNSLGVHLVIVFNADSDIEAGIATQFGEWQRSADLRITTPDQMNAVADILGGQVHRLSAMFAASSPDSPNILNTDTSEVITTSGSFVKAQPIGIVDGTDYQNSGNVRKIAHHAINNQLNQGAIVLIAPLGYSPSGEYFYLNAEHVACETACALNADKLIFLSGQEGLFDGDGELISEIDLSNSDVTRPVHALLNLCDRACHQGVRRCHILSHEIDGAILEELFTRDGCGTQVVGHSYEQIRAATIDDVSGILKLITPLEDQGVLVKRSRELLESEIDQFLVIERDGLLVSCAALYPYHGESDPGAPGMGELACLVTHPDYRKSDRGDRLLEKIESRARAEGLSSLFVLTTQSVHWFQERGFCEHERDQLPQAKRDLYNDQRGSTVLIKSL